MIYQGIHQTRLDLERQALERDRGGTVEAVDPEGLADVDRERAAYGATTSPRTNAVSSAAAFRFGFVAHSRLQDARSGRWKGWDKTECGIHVPLSSEGELPPGYDPVF